jgi:hypothetical protein
MSRQRFPWVWLWATSVLMAPLLAAGASSATPKGFGHVHALLVHPEGETLLVGTHHGLFRSPDAGVTWNRVSPGGGRARERLYDAGYASPDAFTHLCGRT